MTPNWKGKKIIFQRFHCLGSACEFSSLKNWFRVGEGRGFQARLRGIGWWKGLMDTINFWLVVSNMFYFHSYLGKIPILTNNFQRGWNHQLHFIVTEIGSRLQLARRHSAALDSISSDRFLQWYLQHESPAMGWCPFKSIWFFVCRSHTRPCGHI